MADWKPDADAETTGETHAVVTRRRPTEEPDVPPPAASSSPELPDDGRMPNAFGAGLGIPRAPMGARQSRVSGPPQVPQHQPSGPPQSPRQMRVATPPTQLKPQPSRAPSPSLPQSQQGLHTQQSNRASGQAFHPQQQPQQPQQQQQQQLDPTFQPTRESTPGAYRPQPQPQPQQQQQPHHIDAPHPYQPQHQHQHHAPHQQQPHQQHPQQGQPRDHQAQEQQQQQQQPASSQWVTSFHFRRSRTYAFVVNAAGRPVEIGSGRFARVYLGQERWLESVTDLQRDVVIKMMHKNIDEGDMTRFRMEKELLERVQGHPNIVELLGSGESNDPRIPAGIRDQTSGDYMILEKLDMNLAERLKGSRNTSAKEDLLAFDMHDRLLRVLEYMIPIASAVEYAHIVRNVCHRDINPANVLIGLADPQLAGSRMQVRLADFSVAKLNEGEGVTRFALGVPGTMYFQSPEQETNIREILVNVTQGSPEVEYFEDFYINVAKNDTFAIFNRNEEYRVVQTDRVRKRIILQTPYGQRSETNIRARVQKSVGRPADIYALGGLLYYLISGATGNPKVLYDTFHKFIEYERPDETNTIDAYLRHDYEALQAMQSQRSPKASAPADAPANRFFSYKHYFDGNGELIHPAVMTIIARCMIRNKPDSYCQMHDIETTGVTNMVKNLTTLYSLYGIAGSPAHFPLRRETKHSVLGAYGARTSGAIRKLYESYLLPLFEPRKK